MSRRGCTKTAPLPDLWERLAQTARAQAEAEHREHRMQRRRNPRSNWDKGRQTLAEIARLIWHRHLGPCDTDDGQTYLRAAMPWLIAKGSSCDSDGGHHAIQEWAHRCVPRVDASMVASCIAEADERNGHKKLYWKPQALGDLLQLTTAERETLRITRFRPCGMKRCQFAAYQRKRKAEKEQARRIAKGARPQEQSAARLMPWTALGMSERSYYRAKAKGTLPAQLRDSGSNSWQPGTEYLRLSTGECQIVRQTRAGSARADRPRQCVGADGPPPGGKTRAIRAGHAVALPLPPQGVSEHPDLIGGFEPLGAVLTTYAGGMMPPELARAIRDAQRVRMLTQRALANQIGISPPQLANALKGRSGLSRSAATNLMEWLAA